MTIDIEYVPNRTETARELVGEPADDETVLRTIEEEDANGVTHTTYEVETEITITTEKYRIHTAGARGSTSWFYVVEENETGEWEVTKREQSDGRTNRRIHKQPESTAAVRDALSEQHDIEVIN